MSEANASELGDSEKLGKPEKFKPRVELSELVSALGLHQPTPEQAEVATYPPTVNRGRVGKDAGAPLLVVAGAGSGKTETISLRAAYLSAAYEIAPERILGLTFTRKAAAELGERLRQRLQQWDVYRQGGVKQAREPFLGEVKASTYNSFALEIVKEYGVAAGFNPEAGHLSQGAALQLMRDVLRDWQGSLDADKTLDSVAKDCLALRESILNQALTFDEVKYTLRRLQEKIVPTQLELEEVETGKRKTKPLAKFFMCGANAIYTRIQLIEIIKEFEARKAEQGRMDFTDQVVAALEIVKNPRVSQELRQRYQIVFLDEFQDTSVLQLKLFSTLFKNHAVTAVGDPNQAIYGWRGASSGSLSAFHDYFNPRLSSGGGEKERQALPTVLQLSTAWRNDQMILDVANQVAEPLRNTNVGNAPLVEVAKLAPRPNAGSGQVQTRFFLNDREEIDFIVQAVKVARVEQKPNGEPQSIAVLSRRRSKLAQIYEALIDAGIEAQLAGADALLVNPVIADLRAALTVASDSGKSTGLIRLLFNLDLGAADLWALGEWAKDCRQRAEQADAKLRDQELSGASVSAERDGLVTPQRENLLQEAIDEALSPLGSQKATEFGLSPVGFERVVVLGRRLQALRQVSDRSVVKQIEFARRIFHYQEEMLATYPNSNVGEVLDLFTSLAADFQNSLANPTLAGFLEMLEASEAQNENIALPTVVPNPHAVQVMTMHGSKGLEWDVVFVADLAEGHFPSHRGVSAAYDRKGGKLEIRDEVIKQLGWWRSVQELPYPARTDCDYLPGYLPQSTNEETATEQEAIFGEEVGQHLLNEERRLAYVALTRARSRLVLTGACFHGGTNPRVSSRFLRDANCVPGVETVMAQIPETKALAESLVESPEAKMFPVQPKEARKRVAESAGLVRQELENLPTELTFAQVQQGLAGLELPMDSGAIGVLLREYLYSEGRAKRSAGGVSAGVSGFSVSQLVQMRRNPEKFRVDLLRPIPDEPVESEFGTLFHQWVEVNLRQKLLSPDCDLVELVQTNCVVPSQIAESDRDRFFARQQQFAELDLLTKGRILDVEWAFTTEINSRVVRGKVDAVFQIGLGIKSRNASGFGDFGGSGAQFVLVDWKTSNRDTNSLSTEVALSYLTQLQVYRWVWAKKHGVDLAQVDTRLVFFQDRGSHTLTLEQLAKIAQIPAEQMVEMPTFELNSGEG